jgi:glycosyltransferase involved in cell wall biosynthesis
MKRIALDPIRRMGLNDVILLPGYQKGDDFVRTIATMDVKVYLVPGTDGSCRAVREAMAMNVPVIAARRGILPELLGQGRGLLVEDSPATLANAILKMAHDPGARREISRRARQYAVENFALNRQADIVAGIYHSVVKRRKR